MRKTYTKEELQNEFLEYVKALIDYWEDEDRAPTSREKLNGLAFSILVAIDGGAAGTPPYKLIPVESSKDDKEFLSSLGEKWYPKNIDIAGNLHSLFNAKVKI